MATGGSRLLLRLLIGALAMVFLICAGGAALVGWTWRRAAVDTIGKVEFVHRLAIPPLAPSRVDEQGRRVFDLRAQTGRRHFGLDRATPTWGFNGDYLGPTLRARRGEQVVVHVRNELAEPTSVHWHGMHLPAVMDGSPHQPVRPGDSWSPTWTVDQPAATLWYHPHLHGTTARQVYRGLAGLFLVDDEQADRLALPHRYGVDDIPVIVQDRQFHDDGRFDDSPDALGGVGVLGDTLLVNGTIGPYLEVSTERVRLRLLNGSNARVYDFGFADNRQMTLIGTDGGLLAAPHTTNRIRLSPGERAEIVVALRPGERATLRSYPPHLGTGALAGRITGGADRFDVLQLRAAEQLEAGPRMPATLAPIDRLDPATATGHRQLRLTGHKINGRKMDLRRIDHAVTRGATEIWEVTNSDGTPHNFHLHGVSFQVVSVAGQRPPAQLAGWKDTIYLEPGRPARIITRFPGHTDPDVPYMFHCHVLFHEDAGMMGQFVVVAPGQQPGRPAPVDQHGAGHGD